jgi:hypothetical protein
VSFEDDRGANDIGVSGGLCSWNLHAVWDSCLIEQDVPGVARDLLDEVTDQDRATWLDSAPIDWANESFAISVSPEVGYCVRTDAGCWYDTENERLDEGEPERAIVVDRCYIETDTPNRQGPLGQGRRPARRPSGSGAPRPTIWGALARDRPRYSGGHYPATERQAATDTRRSGEPTRKPGRRVEDGQLLPRA